MPPIFKPESKKFYLNKLRQRLYKVILVANSSSSTTNDLSLSVLFTKKKVLDSLHGDCILEFYKKVTWYKYVLFNVQTT